MSDFKAKMHQITFPLGIRPRPRWGSLQRSTYLLAVFKGGLLLTGGKCRGRGGEGKRGKEGRGSEGKGDLPDQNCFLRAGGLVVTCSILHAAPRNTKLRCLCS